MPDYLKPVGGKEEAGVQDDFCPDDKCPGDKCPGNVFEKQGFIIKTPKLKKLCIIDLFIYHGLMYFDLLLKPLPGKLNYNPPLTDADLFRSLLSGPDWGQAQAGHG